MTELSPGRARTAAPAVDEYRLGMCRNITTLRGLEPSATPTEIEAAALQYVRKVSGVQKPSTNTQAAIDEATEIIAAATTVLLGALPPRKVPPKTLPPLRRPEVQARLAKKAARQR
jgi:hypothetical protein